MRKRIPVLVCALMIGALAVAGCGTQQDVKSLADTAVATVLRTPMMAVMRQQEEMVRQLEAGNVNGARASYLALADAFSKVLGPVRTMDPGLAGEMENANTALKELLKQQEPDRAAIGKQAQILSSALRRAADGIGISLVGTAGAQVGTAGGTVKAGTAAAGAKAGTAGAGAKAGTAGATGAGAKAGTAGAGAKAGTAGAGGTVKAGTAGAGAPTGTNAPTPGTVAHTKEQTVEVRVNEYRFTQPKISVKKGTRVTIKLINEGTEKHEFELDAFHFEIKPIASRTSAQASFVADRTGSFEFACHVDSHYQKGMKGILEVVN
ncbi:MAG: hypothetical protein JWN15_4014 [Firmicutes bacterium]|nr:hypothetical protein [Bacillota bacterium]